MSKFDDTLGKKFNRLTAVKFTGIGPYGHSLFEFLCDCGNSHVAQESHVRSGATKSCGCLQRETPAALFTTHGMSRSKEYRSWAHLKGRCLNKNDKQYESYGARGITVCERWLESFENFFSDMGKCPEGLTIDRIDNDGNYEPDNCRWADAEIQGNNRRSSKFIIYDGKQLTYSQWSRELNGYVGLVIDRLRRGWSEEQAVSTPVGAKRV